MPLRHNNIDAVSLLFRFSKWQRLYSVMSHETQSTHTEFGYLKPIQASYHQAKVLSQVRQTTSRATRAQAGIPDRQADRQAFGPALELLKCRDHKMEEICLSLEKTKGKVSQHFWDERKLRSRSLWLCGPYTHWTDHNKNEVMSHKVVAVSTFKIWTIYTYRNRNNVENWASFFFWMLTDMSRSNVTFQTTNQSKYVPPILVPSIALKNKETFLPFSCLWV